mgnify:CR=1 FL=1
MGVGGFEVAQEDELLLLAVLDDRDAMLAAEFEELHAIWAAQMPGGFVESEPGAAFGDVLLGDPLKRFGCKGVGDALGDDAINDGFCFWVGQISIRNTCHFYVSLKGCVLKMYV